MIFGKNNISLYLLSIFSEISWEYDITKKIIVYCLVGNTDRFRPSKRHHKKNTTYMCTV